jgi:hypothetical protein
MRQIIKRFSHLLLIILSFTLVNEANAVPSFARQTGMDCVACHTSFPELTPFGREFKLNGYTLGEVKMTPFAVMVQASYNTIAKEKNSDGSKAMLRNNNFTLDQISLFVAGKINDHAGGFIQITQSNNNGDPSVDTKTKGHSALDNTDLRLIDNYKLMGKNLLLGLNLNNNPTVQDVWNSTPAWGIPNYQVMLAVQDGPMVTKIEDIGSQVAGLGGYFWYDRHLYGELSLYGSATHAFHVLGSGTAKQDLARLEGRNNPYWRLAWSEDHGPHSFMLGTFGMLANVYPDSISPSGPTDKFLDTALDAQYQYISDPSIFTAQTSFIHEKQKWNASFTDGTEGVSNARDTLNSFKAKLSYLYERKYGATLAYYKTFGSEDSLSVNPDIALTHKPNYEWYVAEVNYSPRTNVRLALQYTGYLQYAGSRSNYMDPSKEFSRNPSDNNTLMGNIWFAY